VLKDRLFGPSGPFRRELQEQGIVELPVDAREFFTEPHGSCGVEPYRVRINRPLNPGSCTADDAWLNLHDFMQFGNIVEQPTFCRGLFA